MAQRLETGGNDSGKKNSVERQAPAVPADYVPRGSPARATSRARFDHHVAPTVERGTRKRSGTLPPSQLDQPTITFMTQ